MAKKLPQNNDPHDTLLPEDIDWLDPHGQSSGQAPLQGRGGKAPSKILGLIWLPLRPVRFLVRPLTMLALPLLIPMLISSFALWYFTPTWLAAPIDWITALPQAVDHEQLSDWARETEKKVRALGEEAFSVTTATLPEQTTPGQQVPQDGGQGLSKQLEVVQRKLLVNGELPTTLLAPQPKQ